MINEFKTLNEIKQEKKEVADLLKRTNSAISVLWNNYVNGTMYLFKKQQELDEKIEELNFEIKIREKNGN